MNYLTVDLFKDFNCIADACPNTCCSGWGIIIDEDTHHKMVEHEEQLGIAAKDWLLETDKGFIVKLNQKRCPMLDDCNLCNVVKKLGPEFLSGTCQQYPRILHQYGNTIEGHLTTSCPDVVDKLIEKETVEFDFIEDNTSAPQYAYTNLYLFESAVRSDIVSIIQVLPTLSLRTRLFISYKILDKAIQLYQDNQLDHNLLTQATDPYLQEDTLISLNTQLQNAVDESNRYRFLQKLQSLISNISEHNGFSDYITQTNQFLSQNNLEQYLLFLEKFRAHMQPYNGFYTNYWVYHTFSDILEIPDYSHAKEKLIYVAAKFCLIQTVALGVFANNHKLTRDEYIYIVSCISRTFEHNAKFRKLLTDELITSNMISLAGLLLMLLD